jgi:hypothetical protein
MANIVVEESDKNEDSKDLELNTRMVDLQIIEAKPSNYLPSPILQFPPEIISHIFYLTLSHFSIFPGHYNSLSEKDQTTPFILGAVCRDWRAVTWSTPILWSSIVVRFFALDNNKSTLVKDWLSRSGQHPLSICIFFWPIPSTAQADIRFFGDIINQYSSRWRHFELSASSEAADYFLRPKGSHAPILESLRLEFPFRRNTWFPPWHLAHALPPTVTCLRLQRLFPFLNEGSASEALTPKRKQPQIVGNLASLTEAKDFVPYLDALLPMVHHVLVDPVPEARATAAKALGTLVERLREIHFPDLVPGLLRTLKTDTSGVDRQGAAQGLSEVLSGLGMERLERLLPDIIANARVSTSNSSERIYVSPCPATFGSRFQPHLPKIISPILGGLSDTEDYVREAAMRAGRMVVTNYSTKAIDLLLPELENGMFDPGWRIRVSVMPLSPFRN